MLKRLLDAWGKRKQDERVIAPAPVRRVDQVLGHTTPEAPESDGAGTLTSLNDPWQELMKRADDENMSPEEYNAMIREYYHDDMHRAMLIKECTANQFAPAPKVQKGDRGDDGSVFL